MSPKEVIIDEYQDSNLLQELIIKSVSREQFGRPNIFMVGDVKQSIYKFRLAMPELFMEKYKSYSTKEFMENGSCNLEQRIDLDKNFRSRKVVLDYVNAIFDQIMTEPVGGIVYDEAASLKYGELFEETIAVTSETPILKVELENELSEDRENIPCRIATDVEFMLITEEETGFEEEEGASEKVEYNERMEGSEIKASEEDQEDAVYTKKELEARNIAAKIKELTNPQTGLLIFDNKVKLHRPAQLRDVVILLRSMTGWAEVFVNTLMQEGIPAFADTGTGYFQTLEIMTLLNMLRIIDNPRQDIPFTGVLYSPMVGLTSTELAMIRTSNRGTGMYAATVTYIEEGSDDELKDKLKQFIELLETLRSKVNHIPIHELIQEVLDFTGYGYYVSAMPGGERRKANIDMLVSQAVRFEKGSYSGLFHFIRYIEKLHKYEIDFGEAVTSGEQDNTVRIMSIHKSKGLEFPVVIVAGMSKQFNTQDVRSNIILHNGFGAGPEYINSNQRTKVPTLLKKVIQKKVQVENLGEELRVLYVAMTRAREKLILSGYLKSTDEIRRKHFSFFEITTAKSYLDWVLPAMLNCIENSGGPTLEGGQIDTGDNSDQMLDNSLTWKTDNMIVRLHHKNELLKEELKKQIVQSMDEKELLALNTDDIYDSKVKEEIKTRFNHVYPYQKEAGLRVKMTVSELKKLGQFLEEDQSINLYPDTKYNEQDLKQVEDQDQNTEKKQEEKQEEKQELLPSENSTAEKLEATATIPDFILQKEAAITGTDRGTLYHKVLELLDLTRVYSKEELLLDIHRMVQDNRMKEADVKKLKLDYIFKFTQSDVAQRMRKAQQSGKLYREKQFVMGIEASKMLQSIDSDELILIQGIIDVFFEEEGELVLLDYKSDIIENSEQLVNRYKVQLDYYRKALEQMLQKKVKEILLYSLHLGKEIRIDEDKLVTL